MSLEGADALLDGAIAQDLYLLWVGLAQPTELAIVQVADLVRVKAHDPHSHGVGGQEIGAGDGQSQLNGVAVRGAAALHAYVTVNDTQVGCHDLGQGVEVEVHSRVTLVEGEFVAAI